MNQRILCNAEEILPPDDLIQMQCWFSRVVSRPLLPDGVTNTTGIDSRVPGLEAGTFIHNRNGMDGFERMAVYNRQYWFRLIDCMMENHPCTVRLLGSGKFRAWSARHLDAHKSNSPYLADLERGFYAFLEAEYHDEDRNILLEAVRYDKAFDRAFDAPEGTPLRLEGLEENPVALAPHVTPLRLLHDFGSFRRGESSEILFPAPKEHNVVIYRHHHTLYEKEISRIACRLLQILAQPHALTELFELLEADATKEDSTVLERNLTAWFCEWVELGWLCGPATP